MSDAKTTTAQPPRRRAARRALIALAVLGAAIAAVLVGAIAWIASESALTRMLAEVTAKSGGTLTFEGATGSLLSQMRVRRVEYRDAHIHVVADDVALAWSPVGLWSRELRVSGLGAQRVAITLEPSGSPSSPPASLALPIEVSIAHAGVARLELESGEAAHAIDGIEFGYRGGASAHRLEKLSLVSQWGRVTGDIDLAALPPFGVRGALQLAGSERLRNASANVTLGGSLDALDVRFAARVGAASADGRASVAPLAATPVVSARIAARDIDLAQFDASWPRTLLAVEVDASADAGGKYSGTVVAENAAPGPFDGALVPLTGVRSHFAVSAQQLELTELVAQFGGGGRASGSARIDLASRAQMPPSEWDLSVRELDLARLWRPAIATRLAGRVRARVEQGRQRVDADLAQGDRALAFVATIANDTVDIERFRARAGTGDAAGRAKIALSGTRAFEIAATATRFDPSRFVAAPQASLDGTIDASGRLASPWSARGRVVLQPTSRYSGTAVSGSAQGSVTADAITDATVDARLADASVHAQGSFGRPGDALEFRVDAPRLASLAPLAGARWPRGLAGSIRASGTVGGDMQGPGLELAAHAERLVYDAYSIAAADVRASIVPARTKAGTLVLRLAERPIAITLSAADVRTPQGSYAKASLAIDGTLSRHVASLALAGADLDAQAKLDGGFDTGATLAAPSWSGTLVALDNRGAYAMHLAAPASLAWSLDRVELGSAQVAIADGVFRITVFNWRDGRIDTRGAFGGVPAAALARLAGASLPMRSTLVLDGDWDVRASPRLNGSVHVRRESGDLFADPGLLGGGEIPLGLSTLELAATLANDTLDASASLRAASLGNAAATLRIGQVADARAGSLPPDAPLSATLKADIESLKPLQPLLGTTALVEGRITVEGEAKGSRANLALTGSIAANDLKLAAPQYGVQWNNGRIRARLAAGVLALEELSFEAGDGRFVANGTLATITRAGAPAASAEPSTAITWRAERFRAANRPDMRLVVDGQGTLGAAAGHLLLKGEVKAREGRFELERPTTSTLGPDVVVAGVRRPPPAERFQNVPLGVDLDLDLGDRLYVSGRGLDARLSGRVHIAATATRQLTARGTIQADSGSYDAFGQRLTIQRGRLIFDGPIDNPALDIVAVRKNLPVEAGVQVTGTVAIPHVQLVSDPPVADGEKLSWLVLGQGLDRTSGADAAALQAAAATLFGENRAPLGTTLARRFGFDDIALRSSATTTAAGSGNALGGQVLAVSKRLSDKIYVIYEQGLTVANNALKIEYVLTRNLTLRGEAGTVSGVGIYYQKSFE